MGGAGFLGSNLADALLDLGGIVRIFDRPGIPLYRRFNPSEQIEWHPGDFNSVSDIEAAVEGCQIIYHLVSTTLPKSSNDDPIYDVESNVIGTLKLLEAALHAGVRKVIFVSSGGTVYGIPKQVPITEDHSTNPMSSYGIGKLAIEKYLGLYHELHGLDYAVLRLANPYGKRQRVEAAQGAVAVFLHKAMIEQPVEIWGDGSVVRDYVYVSDVIQAMLKVLDYNGNVRLFNIGSGSGKSLNEILSTIEIILNKPVSRIYKPGRVFDVPTSVLDIQRASQFLDWRPEVSFETGIKWFHNWLGNSSA
jgi:UDP-glucose 4-epimerase